MMSFIGGVFAVLFIVFSVIATCYVMMNLVILGFWTVVGYYYKLTWDPMMNVQEYAWRKFTEKKGKER